MEAFEKIRAFLQRLNAKNDKQLIKFEYFDDDSCSICHWDGTVYLETETLQELLNQIDNYQWDTKTANRVPPRTRVNPPTHGQKGGGLWPGTKIPRIRQPGYLLLGF